MKILYMDMEFANGQVKGSIYSIGSLVTNGHFHIIKKPNDLLINPDCKWNFYVLDKMLNYPRKTVEAAPTFPQYYEAVKSLFTSVDLVVGFAINNDTTNLREDCLRYGLPPFDYQTLDVQEVCKKVYPDFEGNLFKLYEQWTGEESKDNHRSDADAYATMGILKAICKQKHVSLRRLMAENPTLIHTALEAPKKKKKRRYGKHRTRRPVQSRQKPTENGNV